MRRRRRGLGALSAAVAVLATGACERFEPEWVDSLAMVPDSVHVAVGGTAAFTAIPLSARDKELPDRAERVEWFLNAPDVATLETGGGTGTVTALGLGSAVLVARLGRGTAQAPVFVQPPGLARIEIVPDRIDIRAGERPRVEARLYDAQGELLSPVGFRISWEILDRNIGFVGTPTGPSADLLGRRAGTTQLRLIVGSMSTGIPFIVR